MDEQGGPTVASPWEHGLDIDEWAARFHLLGDATRLRLLAAMHQAGPGTASVGELAEAAGITHTAASQALRVLRLQGWVRDERAGRSVRYTLTDSTVHELLHLMGATHE
ncbi:ArsR/SmtB family transcription factor [Tomitella gaofuii]|uniref:ArsR/SmtB family transcription factor n=1 Tax=Tomitella gaofuii TaxID=2760083 RepID=UPI0015F8AF26|nr:metalloregulator ArsR/SmtB family transcription factor [Tomitella gaofuii]